MMKHSKSKNLDAMHSGVNFLIVVRVRTITLVKPILNYPTIVNFIPFCRIVIILKLLYIVPVKLARRSPSYHVIISLFFSDIG